MKKIAWLLAAVMLLTCLAGCELPFELPFDLPFLLDEICMKMVIVIGATQKKTGLMICEKKALKNIKKRPFSNPFTEKPL